MTATEEINRIFDKIDELKDTIMEQKEHSHTFRVEMLKEIKSMPCGIHQEKMRGLGRQIVWLWVLLGGVVATVLSKIAN